MRNIGLHLRIYKDLVALARRALELNLTTFQCFLLHQDTKKHIKLFPQDIKEFLVLRAQFEKLFIHGTYWINLAGDKPSGAHHFIKKELTMAKRLGFTHYILHPGSATGWQEKMQGIDSLVRILNTVTKNENDIQIILENTAHEGMTVGSDIAEFKIIREKLECPEKISFCIDTAHAHAYGYDIVSEEGLENFFSVLEDAIGIENIALLHLNDTSEELGCKQDRHQHPGKGVLGLEVLKRFAHDRRLRDVPVILELPESTAREEEEIIRTIFEWET